MRQLTTKKYFLSMMAASGLLLGLTQHVAAQTRPTSNDCEVGSVITAVTQSAGLARMGSVFSATLYDPAIDVNNTTYNPQKIQVRVTKNGAAKANCSVVWQPNSGTASGWVYPDAAVSDANGYVSAWWVAGTAQNESVNASIQQTDGVIKSTAITGTAYSHITRGNSTHVSWPSGGAIWDRFSVDVTPMTWPATTYYMVIGGQGFYAGIQSNQILFSFWGDDNGAGTVAWPVIVSQGVSACTTFGGEGVGYKCEYQYVPQLGHTYRFEAEVNMVSGKQNYSMYFTDLATPSVRKLLGTLQAPSTKTQNGAYGFVEDWAEEFSSCLNANLRSVKYTNVSYRNAATAVKSAVTTGTGDAVLTPNHNEVCSNYKFDFANGNYNLSSGGMALGYPLNLPNGPRTYPNSFDVPAAPLATALSSGVAVNNNALGADLGRLFSIYVPAGKTQLTIQTWGGTGDSDIYLKLGSAPTVSSYTYASEGATTVETITVNAPAAGTYYVLLNAAAGPISGVSLVATYQ